MLFDHLYIFFEDMSVQVLCFFFQSGWVILFVCLFYCCHWVVGVFCILWIVTLLRHMICNYVLPFQRLHYRFVFSLLHRSFKVWYSPQNWYILYPNLYLSIIYLPSYLPMYLPKLLWIWATKFRENQGDRIFGPLSF